MSMLTPPARGNNTGMGKLVSFVMLICMFVGIPQLCKLFWPFLIENIRADVLFCLQLIAMNIIVLGSFHVVMYFIYKGKYPFFEQYRSHNKPWPWETDYEKWKQFLKKSIGVVIFNSIILTPLFAVADLFTHEFKYTYSMEDWPTTTQIIGQFIFFLIADDVTFYWLHRLLHHPKFYWIHKQHHQYNIPISLTATYAHPIEFIFANALPFGIGYRLLSDFMNVHLVTIVVWSVYRLMETCQNHSGYEFSWGQLSFIPWKLGGEYHDFHHSHNAGNFGSEFGFWDNFMGTNQQYNKMQLHKSKSA